MSTVISDIKCSETDCGHKGPEGITAAPNGIKLDSGKNKESIRQREAVKEQVQEIEGDVKREKLLEELKQPIAQQEESLVELWLRRGGYSGYGAGSGTRLLFPRRG